MAYALITLLNGLGYGLLLFLLSAGLTLVFSLMGVLNFAHASFYMLGAYVAYSLAPVVGFWPALLLSPLLVGLAGAAFERWVLRRVHPLGHIPELMVTFGVAYLVLELVQLVWGRSPVAFDLPAALQGPALTLAQTTDGLRAWWGAAPPGACAAADVLCAVFPASRALLMAVALAVLLGLGLWLWRSRTGWVIQAALTHPQMVQALGHDVPRLWVLVFGVGCALAALAGVVGGATFVTEPAMPATMGPLVFVVLVVGGLGSVAGAFWASLLIGLLQTLAVAYDRPLPLWDTSLAQWAPLLPYALLVLVLALRPRGLMGQRE